MQTDENGQIFHDPHGKGRDALPAIYGFNNGGSPGWYVAIAISADGVVLGQHVCSAEGFVPLDLAVYQGWREDRHDQYRAHYPDGYRMEYVRPENVRTHDGLREAFRLNQQRAAQAETPA